MAVQLEFIDFIVPVAKIRANYPGGWEQCLRDHEPLIGGRVWWDQHLFRDGAMSPNGIRALVEEWTSLGFEATTSRDGRTVWKEVCVVESLFGGPTLPCDWIEVDLERSVAFLRGTETGAVVDRGSALDRESASADGK